MKYKIALVLLIVVSQLIYSQKRKTKMTNKNIPESTWITSEFEKFDSIQFEKLKKKENDTEVYTYLDHGRNIVLRQFKTEKDYSEFIPYSYFGIYKVYYLNNNIATKGVSFIYHGFKVGIWYYYNEDGSLKETVDHDVPFKFTLEQVLQFCKKEGIQIPKTGEEQESFYRSGINRIYNPEKKECYWIIDWFNDKKEKIEEIRLDGKTGKETSRTYMDYVI